MEIIELEGIRANGERVQFGKLQVSIDGECVGWASRNKECVVNFIRPVTEVEIARVKRTIETTGDQRVVKYSLPPKFRDDAINTLRRHADQKASEQQERESRLRAEGFYLP